MVLVDTSVLIDWLRGRENQKTKLFDKIVETSAPFGISILTYQEVIQGAKDDKECDKLTAYLGTQKIFSLPSGIGFFSSAASRYRKLRQSGKTIRSTIDMLIAETAIYYKAKLLHNDRDFDVIAVEFAELDILQG